MRGTILLIQPIEYTPGERTELADADDNDVATATVATSAAGGDNGVFVVLYSRQLFVTIASYFVDENGVLRRRMGLSNNEVSISIFAHFLRCDTIILCVIKIMPNPCGCFVFIQFAQILGYAQHFILYLSLIFFPFLLVLLFRFVWKMSCKKRHRRLDMGLFALQLFLK